MKSWKVTLIFLQKLLAENLCERLSIQNITSYSFNFKGGLCNRRTGYCPYRALCPGGEQFLGFLKNYLLPFHFILLFFWLKQTFFLRRIIVNLCPIMIHVCALDFNVCRSEAVMFLLMLSVVSVSKCDQFYWWMSSNVCAYTFVDKHLVCICVLYTTFICDFGNQVLEWLAHLFTKSTFI